MMKGIKKVLSKITSIIIVVLLLLSIYSFVSIKVLKKDLVPVNGYAVLEVVSGSMQPTINIGDLIIIDINDKNYNKNDIVTFYDEANNFVTHRIISLNENTMVTKGDYNKSDDGETSLDKVVGKYVFRIKGLGNVLSILKKPLIIALIFIISILIHIAASINLDEIKNRNEKEFEEFQVYLEDKDKYISKLVNSVKSKKVKKKKKRKKKKNRKKKKGKKGKKGKR